MSLKKICFFFALSCLMSCGETETKNKPSDAKAPKTNTTAPAKKPKATITQGQNGEKKISLGKINEPSSETSANPVQQSSKNSSSSGYFQSSQYKFKIKHPNSWEKLVNQSEFVPVVFMNRPKGAFSKGAESISIAAGSRPNVTLESFYSFCKDELLQSGETVGIVEESVGKSKGGKIFKRIIFNRKPDPIPSQAVSYVYVENGLSYVVTCSAATQKFNAIRSLFEDVATSIEFE